MAAWQDNTVDESPMMFQYVGSPDTFFFKGICGLKDVPDKDSIRNDMHYIASCSAADIYFYDDYLVFFGPNAIDDDSVLKVEFFYADGKSEADQLVMTGLKPTYGSLSMEEGIYLYGINDFSFESIRISIDTEVSDLILKESLVCIARNDGGLRKEYVGISTLTDENWKEGIAKSRDMILLDRPSVNDTELDGKTIRYGKNEYRITDIEHKGGYTWLYVDEPITGTDSGIYVIQAR